MKYLLLSLALILTPSFASAADGEVVYEGTLTGIVCSACRQHVTAALTENLTGTKEVKIVPSDDAGTQKITITSSSDAVTKDSAIAALGEMKDTYHILTLAKKE